MKYSFIILLNLKNINNVDKLIENSKWRDTFILECNKLIEMKALQKMSDAEWQSRMLQFCSLYFIFEEKHNGRYKVQYRAGENCINYDNIEVSDITAQNSVITMILLVSMQERNNLIFVDAENAHLNTETSKKASAKLWIIV